MLRAGPFSDERIVRLANRRFVAFYFDLSDRGAAGDPDARAFVVARRKELGGRAVPTPPVLFMTAAGDVLGEVSNYATEDQVLAAMRTVLEEHPEFDRADAQEKATLAGDPVAAAEVLIDLQDLAGARQRLADAAEHDARAHYLLGRLARLEHDWDRMERHFAAVERDDLADDVRMERAQRHWIEGDFAALAAALADFPKDSNRYTEARYYEGLAAFHRGDPDAARAIWRETAATCAQDGFIYRADWAYSTMPAGEGQKRPTSFSSARKTGLLGRIGYMGRDNPDLQKRD